MSARLKLRLTDERGQAVVEYALVLALVALVVLAALTGAFGAIETKLESLVTAIRP